MSSQIEQIKDILKKITPEARAEIVAMAEKTPIWVPLPGPQTDAYYSPADILYYGGAAGGGKTDLILGLALTQHYTSIILRRQATQLVGIQSRLLDEILSSRKGWNGQDDVLRYDDRRVEFGSCNTIGDEIKYQGRPHSLKAFDEITHFSESQFRFLCGWKRTTRPGERQRIVCAGNPPTEAEGDWVVEYWGPWLNPLHPRPAKPGELRWYSTIDGKDVECPSGEPFVHNGELITPLSRTFIPSRVEDNDFLMETGYKATLQSLPEPLRSQMLNGDFAAGKQDNVWQVIPTAWVEAAMQRWKVEGKQGQMDSLGCDVARGGADQTIIASRYGTWFDGLKVFPGAETPNGPVVAGLIVSALRDAAPVHIDISGGYGGSPFDHLQENGYQVVGINNAATDLSLNQFDKETGQLKFRNNRAFLMWRLREALDPDKGEHLALPPDTQLKADLCAPLWKLTAQGIQIELKDEIIKRIGRSPDRGDAVILAFINTIKTNPKHQQNFRRKTGSWRAV